MNLPYHSVDHSGQHRQKSVDFLSFYRRGRSGSSTGFTLIELLIVFAVIVVLMAMLFTTFERTREQTQRAVCASNLQEMGTALAAYAADNDGWLPYGDVHNNGLTALAGDGFPAYLGFVNRASSTGPEWVGAAKVYWCPSTTYTKAPQTIQEGSSDTFDESAPYKSCRVSYEVAGVDTFGHIGIADEGGVRLKLAKVTVEKRPMVWDLYGASNYNKTTIDKRFSHGKWDMCSHRQHPSDMPQTFPYEW